MIKSFLALALFSSPLIGAEIDKNKLIAAVLVLEAANQGKNGMCAVHEVLVNRAGSNKIDSKYAQARKPRQFSCLNNMSDSRAIQIASKSPAWSLALQIAANKINSNLTYGATSYWADSIPTPHWARNKRTLKVGNHIFIK